MHAVFPSDTDGPGSKEKWKENLDRASGDWGPRHSPAIHIGCDCSGPSFLVSETISTSPPGRREGKRDGTVDCQLEVIFKYEALMALMAEDQPSPWAHRLACCPGALSSTKQRPGLLPALPCTASILGMWSRETQDELYFLTSSCSHFLRSLALFCFERDRPRPGGLLSQQQQSEWVSTG